MKLRKTFETWRGSRTKQGKIPEYLWAQVLNLIGVYSVSKIVQTLGMSGQQLKSKMNEVANAEFEELRQAHFSEVSVASPASVAIEDELGEQAVENSSQVSSNNVVPFTGRQAPSKHDITIERADGAKLTITGMSRTF